ncbi:MAG TPA: hypothetical protein ENJ52_14510 [Aliiroseovarius sp.]|nr:hypothetical protein [Aliiroseovarius sp.]
MENHVEVDEPLMRGLNRIIRGLVRVMAVLMVVLIALGVFNIGWLLYEKFMAAPQYVLTISDILAMFGAFMAVLIAMEIFVNITIYLRDDIIHVRIVLATALMAIARKVIILDFKKTEPAYLIGIAAIVLALGVVYWLVSRMPRFSMQCDRDYQEKLDADVVRD